MESTRYNRSGPASGFTLIELLVVIAILAILISIISPALSQIRASTRNTECLSHLNQQAAGFLAACIDQDGKLPFYRRHGDRSFRIFYDFIDAYCDVDGIVLCPENTAPRPGGGWWGGRDYPWIFNTRGNLQTGSYVFNAWLHDAEMSWYGLGKPRGWFGHHLSSILMPSSVPMAGDGYWVDAWPQPHHPVPPSGDESNLQGSGHWMQRIFTDRHYKDRQNFSFVDGHARTIKHDQITSLIWSRDFL